MRRAIRTLRGFFCAPRWPRLRFCECAARSGKSSDDGLALANMASVHSGFSLSITSAFGFCFFITFDFRTVGTAETDRPSRWAGFGEDHCMTAATNVTDGEKAG